MTYSYSGPLTYEPQQNGLYYQGQSYQKPSAVPAALTGAVLGGATGAVIANCKKPYMPKNGEFADSFVKTVYDKYMKNANNSGKEAYEGGLNILKNIDSVKSAEELKTLFKENELAAKDICTELKQTPEEFLERVTDKNLNKNKKTIKEKINAGNNTRYQDMKNQLEACWDKSKKKFVENDSVKEEVFKAIKKSSEVSAKTIGKHAAIGAAVAGVLGFISAKLFIK